LKVVLVYPFFLCVNIVFVRFVSLDSIHELFLKGFFLLFLRIDIIFLVLVICLLRNDFDKVRLLSLLFHADAFKIL